MPPISMTSDEGTNYSAIMGDITTYVQECTVKFITGAMDVDKEWDNYVSQIQSMGIEQATEYQQAALDKMCIRDRGYRILFYPGGGIHGFAILPDTEPQEYQLLPFLSGLEEKAVCETEVKGAFFRFQRLPADRGDDGIQGKGTQGGPYIFLHVAGGGTAGIMELASQDQERLIVYI